MNMFLNLAPTEEQIKRQQFYKILDAVPLETIANAFKAASILAEGIQSRNPDPYLLSSLKQENNRNAISIAASKLELAAHT